jgi:hypothetical protein
MYYIKAKTVTDVTYLSASVPEDPTPAWVSGTSYVVGAEVHLPSTHRVYKSTAAGVSTTSPDLEPTRWVDTRPTNKWAAFDIYTGTKTTSTTSLSFSVQYGFFSSVALYGLEGASYSITATEGVGGAVYWSASGSLSSHISGWYGYFFGQREAINKLVFSDIPLRPNGVLNVTITATAGQQVACGMCVAGNLTAIIGTAAWGGTDWGASVEPITYSYLEPAEDGTLKITRRWSATNLKATVNMPRENADQAVAQLQSLLDIPVAWVATLEQGYVGLSTFGLGEGEMVYESISIAKLSINVRGIV